MPSVIRIGLERCFEEQPESLIDARFSLLMNQASVDAQWRYACDLLAMQFPDQLVAMYTPQHGLWGEQQANMIESPHGRYEPLNIPIFSLYGETRRPTREMSKGECLVIDLQDVGTRVYTFVWTMANCLMACAEIGLPVVVLDRPNPLGGQIIEGPYLETGWESFVGMATIPMRHGLTIGELAQLINYELRIQANLEVVPMTGWRRNMLFPATNRTWIQPSPNMPRFETALFYPGQVLLEGTNLSEGRGTTIPFEVVGAPFIDPHQLLRRLIHLPHPGIQFRAVRFVPTFDKWKGQSCGGVAWHFTDPQEVRSFITTLSVITAVRDLWPDDFSWLPPPYEYEREKMPIDILFGSDRLRESLTNGQLNGDDIEKLAHVDQAAWLERTRVFRLYE